LRSTDCSSAITTRGAQVQTRRTELFAHTGIAAHRAREQTTGELALVVVFGTKPAFEHMVLGALKV
jgi:hypothetical protein